MTTGLGASPPHADGSRGLRDDLGFRRLAEAIPQVVWVLDVDGSCRYVNGRWSEFTGEPAARALGLGWLDRLHPDDRDPGLDRWRECVRRAAPFDLEWRIRRNDGRDRRFRVRAEPLGDDPAGPWFAAASEVDAVEPSQDVRFDRIVESASDGIWRVDDQGLTRYVNGRMAEMLGWEPQDLIGRSCLDFLFDCDHEAALSQLDLRRQGDRRTFEWRWRHRDGSEVWTLASCSPVWDGDRYLGALGLFTDVTDRRQAERRIRESEERFRASIGTLLDCFGIFTSVRDASGTIVDFRIDYLNEAACRNNRLTYEEQVGRNLLEILPAHRENGLLAAYCKLVETGEPLEFLMQFVEDDYAGKREARWFDIRASRLGDGFVAAWRDTTDLKQVELALRESEERYRTLFGSIDEGFCLIEMIFDAGGQPVDYRFLETNAAFEAHTGLIDAAGKTAREMVPDLDESWFRLYGEVARTGRPTRFENHAPAMDRWFSVFASRVGGPESRRVALVFNDITERKRADDALRESEERFRTLADSMPLLVWVTDAQGHLHYVNKAYGEFFGVTLEQVLGPNWMPLMHPVDGQSYASEFFACVWDRRPFHAEVLVRDGRGRWRCLESWGRPRFSGSGEFLGMVGTSADVTEARHDQAERRRLAEQRQLALDAARLGWWYYDPAERVASCDGRSREILGFTVGEPPIGELFARLHPEDIQRVVEAFERSLDPADPRPLSIECRVGPAEGPYRWVEARGLATFEGQGAERRAVSLVGTVADVTDRKHADEALRESEGRFRAMADTAPAMIWITDASHRCTFLSRGWYEYTGQTEAEALGMGWTEATHPDDRERARDSFLGAAGRREPFQLEYRLRTAAGDHRWAIDAGRPRIGAGGEFLGYIGAVIDIHDRRCVEEALAESTRLAEAASRAKSEFLANMSHEIRTPMTAILGYADILARQVDDPDDRQCVDTIRRNGLHLLEILNDILDLSKIEAGRLDVDPHRFAPDRLLEDVRSLMDGRAREKGLPLDVAFAGPFPETIQSDPTRLRQILVNLIGNAIKFTEAGSVRVVVRLEPDADAPRLRFDVVDTGIGVSEEQVERLFQPFSQADTSVTRLFGGTGLGLAICQRLVDLLGGSIGVESQPGRGSRFWFTIATGPLQGVPMVEPGGVLSPREVPTPVDPPRRLDCRVLVVDDRPDIRSLARIFLEGAGARVETADDGRAAIEIIDRSERFGMPYDIVVMDMQMPRLDGYSAVTRLRAEGFDRPILALTASAMRGDRDRCLAVGCDDYLAKPIDPRRLVELVGRYTSTPVAPEAPAEVAPAAPETPRPPSRQARAGRRVLVVDDSPDICRVMGRLLGWSGHETRTAVDGQSALEVAREFRPEVVLLDLGLPDVAGRDLIDQLKRLDGLAGATYIAVTGRGSSEEREQSIRAGFHHHLVKPVDLDSLLALFP